MSYICRRKIREILSKYTRDQIVAKYKEYDSIRKRLDEIPNEIALIRENKDLSDDESMLIAEVDKYSAVLDEVLKIYDKVNSLFA